MPRFGIDYHISVDTRFYSVPHALVGHEVEVRLTAAAVEVYQRGKRVASHQRQEHTRYSTVGDHIPALHREHRDWSPSRFIDIMLIEQTKDQLRSLKLTGFLDALHTTWPSSNDWECLWTGRYCTGRTGAWLAC